MNTNTDKSNHPSGGAPTDWTLTEHRYQYDELDRLTCDRTSVRSVDHPSTGEGADWKGEPVEEKSSTTRIVKYRTDADERVIMRRVWEQNS